MSLTGGGAGASGGTGPFVFAPGAVVRHAHDLTLFSFLQLHFCYGRGTFEFRRGCVAKGLRRVAVSQPLWYWKLILSGMEAWSGAAGVGFTTLLAATQAASAFSFLSGWVERMPSNGVAGSRE